MDCRPPILKDLSSMVCLLQRIWSGGRRVSILLVSYVARFTFVMNVLRLESSRLMYIAIASTNLRSIPLDRL